MENEDKCMVEVASQLSSANWQPRTPSYICREHSETLQVLAFLTDAIPWWFSNLGSVEVPWAHHVGAPEEDSNSRHVARSPTERDPESGVWCGRGVGGKVPSASPLQKLDLRCWTGEWNIFSTAHGRSRIPSMLVFQRHLPTVNILGFTAFSSLPSEMVQLAVLIPNAQICHWVLNKP